MLLPKRLILVVPAVLCCRTTLAQPTFSANDFACFVNRYNAGNVLADMDASGSLTANDFVRFQNFYAARDPRANCDGSTGGWTDLTAPPGSLTYYVAANGSDSNPGTEALPFRTLGRGTDAIRQGFPDQLLLRCGDTWTETIDVKWSGSDTTYLVIGSYGTGARPKLLVNDQAIFAGGAPVGLAIVGLHIEYTGSEDNKSSLYFREGTRNILIEDCFIAKYGDGIVMHESAPGRLTDIKIRRNIIVDTDDGTTRSQGVFFGVTDGLLLEGNVIDRTGWPNGIANTNGHHAVYIHETCGAAVVKDNIFARSLSHGMQQRPGGECRNNLLLDNAINCYVGGAAGVSNVVAHNVAIEAHDITTADRRGTAFELGGFGTIEYNLAAYQTKGTADIAAFAFSGFNSGTVRGNYVYDWGTPLNAGWETAVQWDGGSGSILFEDNTLYMPTVGMLVRHESRPLSGQFTYRNNTYWTSTPSGGVGGYSQFSTGSGAFVAWSGWQAAAGEAGSVYLSVAPEDPDATMASYLTGIGFDPGTDAIATFIANAKLNGKAAWDVRFTADAFNDWARARCGVQPN